MTTDLVTIHGHSIRVKQYKGKRVVTFKDIDEAHERPIGTANRNFQANRQRFINCVDFFVIKPKDIDPEKDEIRLSEIHNSGVTLITESGYLMLVKSFTDELAWQVQRELVDSYFRPEIKVMPAAPIIDRDTCLEAARIMASVPYSKQEVVNCLKHLIPDIDAGILKENKVLPDKNVEKKEEPPKKEWKEFYKQGVPVDVSKLKKQIRQQKIKVSEIAHKAGVSDSTIYNILNGKTRPTKETKEHICSALKKDPDWLDL